MSTKSQSQARTDVFDFLKYKINEIFRFESILVMFSWKNMTYIIQEELQNALKCLEQALKQYESLQTAWQLKEANYVKIQVELISKNDALRAQSQELSQNLIKVQSDFKIFKDSHEGCGDRITAYRSVAKALESENQLLAGEKNHLEQFKIQYCNNNGALK